MPLRRIAVREIMGSEVATVTPDTPVSDLVRQMTEHKDDCPYVVVVVDPERRPVGIVTERDVMSKVLAGEPPRGEYLRNIVSSWDALTAHIRDQRKSQASVARDLMTTPAVCIDEDASVAELSGIMEAHGLRQLPVVREGVVVGLVCRRHVVAAIAELYREGSGPVAEG